MSAISGGKPAIILDISRLIQAARLPAPTGVDRVEMAYAQTLLEVAPDRVRFATVRGAASPVRLQTSAARRFIEALAARWESGGAASAWRTWRALAGLMGPELRRPDSRGGAYVIVSHRHLDRERRVARILAAEQARLICLIHDLIPVETPEYARALGTIRHERRLATVGRLASGVITISEATRDSLRRHLGERADEIPIRVAHLGVPELRSPPPRRPSLERAAGDKAYFVVLGTIEPRKNHLLLLNLWRAMVQAEGAAATPELYVIGRRGWENENIVDMLERCPALQGVVHERAHLSDAEVRGLIAGARAVLMPSFAEGFGLPVIEAMQMGTPAICSDVAALREAGQGVPDHLDPLDGPAWRGAILDYARADSPARRAQLERLKAWRAPTWRAHMSALFELVDGEAGR